MGVWELGTINLTNGNYYVDNRRIRTVRKVKYDKDINIYVNNLYALYIMNYDNEDDTVPASYRVIYPNNSATIEKDKWTNFVILGWPNDITGTAVVEEMKKVVQVYTLQYDTAQRTASLEGHVERLERALSEQNNSEQIVDGIATLIGTYEIGSINPVDGAYTNNMTWIRTIRKVKYDKDISVHVAPGYSVNFVLYDNESDTTPASYVTLYPNNSGTVQKNKWMNICIFQNPNVVDPVDIESYKKKIEVYTLPYNNAQNISKLLTFKENARKAEPLSISFLGLNDAVQARPIYNDADEDIVYKDDSISVVSTSATYQDILLDILYPKVGRTICLRVEPTKEFVGIRIIAYNGETQSSTIICETGTNQVNSEELMIPFGTKLLRAIIYIAGGTAVTADETYEFHNVKLYYKDEDSFKAKRIINPRLNLMCNDFIVENVRLLGTNEGNFVLDYQAGAKSLVMPLFDFGAWSYTFTEDGVSKTIERKVYMRISGMRPSVWGHRAVLLDKDMNALGTYTANKWDWQSDDYDIDLSSAGTAGAKYIAIKLFDSSDLINANTAYYVMSARERENRMPDWVKNVVINYNFKTNGKQRKEVQFGFAYSWWDDAKKYNNQKFGNIFKDKLYDLHTLIYNENFNFIHVSDSHIPVNGASRRNVVDMIDFANSDIMATNLDCIIHNGDVSMIGGPNPKQKKIDLLEDYFSIVKDSAVDFIQAVGNHDKGQEANSVDTSLTNTEFCNMLKQYTKHTENTLYQYYDYADKKIRIIKIDGFDYPLEDDGNGKVKYNLAAYNCYISQSQFQWIVSTLLSTPEGYSVIVTGHIYPMMKLVTPLTELMYGLKNKLSGTISIDLSTETLVPPNPTFDVSYNFTGANNVNIIGLFCGHDHIDSYKNTDEISGSTPNTHGVNVIGIRCQMMRDIGWNTTRDRFPYTDSQNCFNMISVDTKKRKMYITRYGVDADLLGEQANLYGQLVFDLM